MTKIDNMSNDKELVLNNTKEDNVSNTMNRYCTNCNQEYSYDFFSKTYPELYHNLAKEIWKNPRIDFYCQYCYLLKLIKFINKKNKKEN